MKKPVSLFILDVTNSTGFPGDLEAYLTEWQDTLRKINSKTPLLVKHRQGDEIICLVEGFVGAFLIANYIVYNWSYTKNMPYFGISCGFIDRKFNELDIDTWSDVLVKDAKDANNIIKNNKNRKKIMEFNPFSYFSKQDRGLINAFLDLQSLIILQQTPRQREILGLYSLYHSQKEVALVINKSTSTISEHYIGGNVEIILETANALYKSIEYIERQLHCELDNKDTDIVLINSFSYTELEKSIREKLKQSNLRRNKW
ncbi:MULTISPECIES: hypothetical protein [Solibacillus]|uniref:Uncharacterized protein n=1 Tax=Solibacillus merdavium TaxID=2762218 RepID=A0ABR8XSZ5_9BACL|nr:hypothetical protein [Solibacillus merdavium]MBD8035042.1 hypothetical protein [Solibacillus merdavium]